MDNVTYHQLVAKDSDLSKYPNNKIVRCYVFSSNVIVKFDEALIYRDYKKAVELTNLLIHHCKPSNYNPKLDKKFDLILFDVSGIKDFTFNRYIAYFEYFRWWRKCYYSRVGNFLRMGKLATYDDLIEPLFGVFKSSKKSFLIDIHSDTKITNDLKHFTYKSLNELFKFENRSFNCGISQLNAFVITIDWRFLDSFKRQYVTLFKYIRDCYIKDFGDLLLINFYQSLHIEKFNCDLTSYRDFNIDFKTFFNELKTILPTVNHYGFLFKLDGCILLVSDGNKVINYIDEDDDYSEVITYV